MAKVAKAEPDAIRASIPVEWQDMIGEALLEDPAFLAAWEHAARKNPESNKACFQYAMNHYQSFEDEDSAT